MPEPESLLQALRTLTRWCNNSNKTYSSRSVRKVGPRTFLWVIDCLRKQGKLYRKTPTNRMSKDRLPSHGSVTTASVQTQSRTLVRRSQAVTLTPGSGVPAPLSPLTAMHKARSRNLARSQANNKVSISHVNHNNHQASWKVDNSAKEINSSETL